MDSVREAAEQANQKEEFFLENTEVKPPYGQERRQGMQRMGSWGNRAPATHHPRQGEGRPGKQEGRQPCSGTWLTTGADAGRPFPARVTSPRGFGQRIQRGRGRTRLWDFHLPCHHFVPLDKRSSWSRCPVALPLPASDVSRRLGTGAGLAAVGRRRGVLLQAKGRG